MSNKEVTDLLSTQGIDHTDDQYSQIFSEFEAEISDTKKGQDAEELKETAEELLKIETTIETGALQEEIEQEKPSNGSFFNLIKNNTTTYNTMASFVAPNEKEQEKEKKIKERSDKIEHIRGDFALGTLSPEIQKALQKSPQLQNIKTGLSLYFTDRFNNLSASDLTQVDNMGGFSGLISKASDLMGMFGKFKSFTNQMTAINTVVEGMDIHSAELLRVNSENNTIPLHTLPAFQSAEGFYKLLVRHTPTTTPTDPTENHTSSLGFDEMFALNEQGDNNSATAIIDKLGNTYNDTTHKLLGSVLAQGPQILKKRSELQTTFGVVYDQLNQVAQLFGNTDIAQALEGTALGRVANFVCVLLGFGSLAQINRKNLLKEYNKNCPARQKTGIEHALHYVTQFSKEPYYTDKTDNPLHKIFDGLEEKKYTDAKTTKEAVLAAIPHDKLIKDGIVSALNQKGFFVHPQVLVGANIKNFKISDYYDRDDRDKPYKLKKEKTEAYKTFISDHIDDICKSAWTPLINPPDTIIQLVASGKTQDDIAQLLVTSLSLPEYATTILQDNLMTLGASTTTLALAGYGKAQAEALETQQIQETTMSLEQAQKKLQEAKQAQTRLRNEAEAKKKELAGETKGDNKEKIEQAIIEYDAKLKTTQEEIDKRTKKVEELENSSSSPSADTPTTVPVVATEIPATSEKSETGNEESEIGSYDQAYITTLQNNPKPPNIDYLDDPEVMKFLFAQDKQQGFPLGTLATFISIESSGRLYDSNGNIITSKAGAKGLLQFMKGTAKEYAILINQKKIFDITDATFEKIQSNPIYAIAAATVYIGKYITKNKPWKESNYQDAIIAYNAGPGKIGKRIPQETQNYITQFESIMANLYGESTNSPYMSKINKIKKHFPLTPSTT